MLPFNSIKVRLKPVAHHHPPKIRDFQFHKGAIETNNAGNTIDISSSFNSIKVRLKLSSPILFNALGYFQFHKGAIETSTAANIDYQDKPFKAHPIKQGD